MLYVSRFSWVKFIRTELFASVCFPFFISDSIIFEDLSAVTFLLESKLEICYKFVLHNKQAIVLMILFVIIFRYFWGSNPSGAEIFRNRPDGPWGSLSLLYNEYRLFLGGKATGT